MLLKILLLAVITAAAHAWWRGARMREAAVAAARRTCDRVGVQLLDDTVALQSWRLARDKDGRWMVVRTYGFEFATDGRQRYNGWVKTEGRRLTGVMLEPYPEDPPLGQGS
jgi:hypothetical protein